MRVYLNPIDSDKLTELSDQEVYQLVNDYDTLAATDGIKLLDKKTRHTVGVLQPFRGPIFRDSFQALALQRQFGLFDLKRIYPVTHVPERIREMVLNMATQDPLMTAYPIYQVRVKRRYVCDGDGEGTCWVHTGDEDFNFERGLIFEEPEEHPEQYDEKGYDSYEEIVFQAFTHEACETYIRTQSHHIFKECAKDKPFVYVDSNHRNTEMKAVHAWLMSLVAPTGRPVPSTTLDTHQRDPEHMQKLAAKQPERRRPICAALRAADGDVMVGLRHYSCDMHRQIQQRADGEKFLRCPPDEQGFVDQWGNFLTREESYIMAKAQGLLRNDTGGPELFSEDLY